MAGARDFLTDFGNSHEIKVPFGCAGRPKWPVGQWAICRHQMAHAGNGHYGCQTRRAKIFSLFSHTHHPSQRPTCLINVVLVMGSPKKSTPKAKWDSAKDSCLISLLLTHTRAGEKSDSGFKTQIWNAVTEAYNKKWKPKLKRSQLQSRSQSVSMLLKPIS